MQGLVIPVIVTVYADRSFTFITKSRPLPSSYCAPRESKKIADAE